MRTQFSILFGVIAFFTVPSLAASNGTGICAHMLEGASTSGLLDAVTNFRNTLGYAGLDSIDERKAEETVGDACTLKIAKLINKKGAVVKPSSDGAQAAVRSNAAAFGASSCPGFGLCAEIYDGKDADVWPISTLTYIIVPTNTTDWEEGCDKMRTLYEYVRWILENEIAEDIAKQLSMAVMPVVIARQAKALLDEMQCHDNTSGLHYVKDRPTWTTSATRALTGSGSSLQQELQTRLTNAYFKETFVSISYTPSSSGMGRSALKAREHDFAGSDSILDMTDPEFISRRMKMIPAFAAAVGVVYNLDQVEELVLSRDVAHKMFTGDIFSWSDPAILADNPGIAHLLPDEAIIRTVRQTKSGTTEALTRALYSFAGHPTDAVNLDYDLDVLKGSALPDWPAQPQPYPGNTVCKFADCIRAICEPGLYLRSEECAECPLGTFSDKRGQHTECEPCPPGSYTNSLGNTKCVRCDDLKYQDEAGQSLCKACPANSRRFAVEVVVDGVVERVAGAGVQVEECKCIEGFWLPASVSNASLGGQACSVCPDGAVCHGFPRNIPQPKAGFWGEREHPQEFFECAVGACLKEYACTEGHEGRMCALPSEGYFWIGELWFFKCPGPGWRVLFTLVCVVPVVMAWMLMHFLSLKYDAFAIVFLFFQMIGLISKFRLRWHPNLKFVLIALRIINFDVDFFGPQCMLPGWNAVTGYFVQLLLPFIVVGCCTAWFYLSRFLKRRRNPQSATNSTQVAIENKGYLRSTAYVSPDLGIYLRANGMSYLIMMFHTLAYRAFSVFVCEADPDGIRSYMREAQNVQCWTGTHILMAVFSLLYIPTIIIGIPLYLSYKMYRAKQEDKLGDVAVAVSYWFIFAKFEVGYPFWEMVLLMRRFVLTLLVVFVPVSMLQAALAVSLLNGFLYLHLTNSPFKDKRIGLLDSFGVCCSMAFAVCGMLFYPSLDNVLECVGSIHPDDLADQCQRNEELKQSISVMLLLLLFVTLLAALHTTVWDIREKMFSAAAGEKIEADKKWYGRDKVFKAIDQLPQHQRSAERISAICESLAVEQSAYLKHLQEEQARKLDSAKARAGPSETDNISNARRIVDLLLGFRESQSRRNLLEVQQHDFANPGKLKLCDLLVGDCLQSWHKSLSMLSEKELAVRLLFSDQLESESMKQELAYMDLEMWIPAFLLRHEQVNGFFSNNQLARILRALSEELPQLINWLATVDSATVQSFSNVVNSYTIFAKTNGNVSAFHKLIIPVHKAQVVHWLMQCSKEDQQAFLTIFGAMNQNVLETRANSWLDRISRTVTPLSSALGFRRSSSRSRVSPGMSPRPEEQALGTRAFAGTSASQHARVLTGHGVKAPLASACDNGLSSASFEPQNDEVVPVTVVVDPQAAAEREEDGNEVMDMLTGTGTGMAPS